MREKREKVLIVDDNNEYRTALAQAIENDFDVLEATNSDQAMYQMTQGVEVVLLDIRLNETDWANREGLKLLKSIKLDHPNLPVVMMTNYADTEIVIEAFRLGAADFIPKTNFDISQFRHVVRKAIKKLQQERRLAEIEEEFNRQKLWEMVGDSPQIQEIRQRVDIVAKHGYSTVLIRGETGTGKELVARAIHSRGWRASAPFVSIAIPTLPRDLVEDGLFGHTKGSFTGAKDAHIGFFEKARGGVLFLDEIGDLSFDIQVKLLRFLENKTINRVGSTQEIQLDLQIVAATNRNLEAAIKQGEFREDLYFRLKMMQINVPPLRERLEDVPLLADYFIFRFRQKSPTKVGGISLDALSALKSYDFPGNVRQLDSIINTAIMMADSRDHLLIEVEDLELAFQGRTAISLGAKPDSEVESEEIDLDLELAKTELLFIQKVLQATDGKKTEAWKMLGLNDRFALHRRVKIIGRNYPHLIESFPLVQKYYSKILLQKN